MPSAVGGGASAPTPGRFLIAALANCDTTMVAIRAAMLGIKLDHLEVTVENDWDDQGLFGIDDSIPAGPLQVKIIYKVASNEASPEELRQLIEWGEAHSPVGDAISRAILTTTVIDIL